VPYLTVTGESSWTCRGKRYNPGTHKVPKAVAQAAMDAGIPRLIVTGRSPSIRKPRNTGPLQRDEVFTTGTPSGVQIGPEPREPVVPEPVIKTAEDLYDVPLDHECPWCPDQAFPSAGALGRHKEAHHAGMMDRPHEALAEPHGPDSGAGPLPWRDAAVDS